MADEGSRPRHLVTGASGLLGGALAWRLMRARDTVFLLVRDMASQSSNLRRLTAAAASGADVHVLSGDITDFHSVLRAVAEAEPMYVWHAAALTQVGEARLAPALAAQTNILGTVNVMEAVRQALGRGADIRAVIHASSDKVYGSGRAGLEFEEHSPLCPRHVYDASKAAAEMMAWAYAAQMGVPVVISRMANLYGPGDTNWRRLIPAALRHLVMHGTRRPFVLRSRGGMLREYLYISDAVDAWLKMAAWAALRRQEAAGGLLGIFNLGSGERYTALEVLRLISEVTGKRLPIAFELTDEAESEELSVDSGAAARVLGWTPTVGMTDGLRWTWGWMMAEARAADTEADSG